jgi:hypothetical protein
MEMGLIDYLGGEVITSYASYAIPLDQRTALPTIIALFNHQYLSSERLRRNHTSHLLFPGTHGDGNHTLESRLLCLPIKHS